jgi:hypothetical protein
MRAWSFFIRSKKMIRKRSIFTVFLFACALLLCRSVFAETVALPLSLDSQLLRSMIIKAAYTDEGRTAVLAGHRGGCKAIILSEPKYVVRGDRLVFETRVFIKAGFGVGDTCILPVSWEGYVALTQVPVIDDRWVLSFRTVESAVYNLDHEPAHVMGFFWNLIKTHVFEYLSRITINLAPPVEDLRVFTRDLFPSALQERAGRILDSFRPGKVETREETVTVEILAEVDQTEREEKAEEDSLEREEVERFISMWETWDAYFVQMVTSLPKEQLSVGERELILDVLLDARHRFEDELLESGGKGDFLRKQFIEAWSRLSPIFKRRMSDDPARPLLDYLAFFTASDALVALDRVGPGLGIEISRDGLIHLARLISSKEITDLPYEFIVDEDLRSLLGLGAPLPFAEPSFDEESIDVDPEEFRPEEKDWLLSVKAFFIGTAWAKTDPKQAYRDRVTPWLVPKGDVQPYLKRVRALLNGVSAKVFHKTDLDEGIGGFYNLLVLSTAWQETCFRQFVVEGGKATYLRSYNRTSVGIMQINERVWRGVYDLNHLRWDIVYNATAGCEILGIYLKKYALPEIEKMGSKKRSDQETLASLAYAVYCGGPSQLQKWKERSDKGRPGIIDKLFLEKYHWVCTSQWEQIGRCL